MAIIDVVRFDGPADVLVWRHPTGDLVWGTQVIVNQTQEALFLKGGQIADVLGPGTHTLKTANLPLLRSLVESPFGGQTPFAAEVYFVNKAVHMDVKWGTTTPIPLLDPIYKVALPVRGFGQFGVRVIDSKQLFTQLSATRQEFTTETLAELFKGALMMRVKDYIAETMIKQRITLLELSAHLEEISTAIGAKLSADFKNYGVEVVNFFVSSIDVPEDDESVKRLKKALADKAELDIMGDGYRTKRTFDTLEKAAGNEGMGGAGMGLGMGLGTGAGMGQLMAGALGQAATTGGSAVSRVAMAVCAACRAENPVGAKFCNSCGKPVAMTACPKCKADLPPGARFCNACGGPVA
jgi:membrane protease subunit (stomatin/prohibitin family)